MRANRVLLVSITALATVAGLSGTASAAPGSATHIVAPYTTTYAGGSTDCRPGATCTPIATASAATGAISASVDLQRQVADEPATESVDAFANQYVDVRVPKGATKLTATILWTVRSASTSASADHGFAFASTLLYANGTCTGCSSTTAEADLVSSSSIPGSDNTHSLADVQKTLTVTIDNLPGKGTARLYTGGSAYTAMNASHVCTGLPGCDQLPPTDPNHSGAAHAHVDAALVSVDVSYA